MRLKIKSSKLKSVLSKMYFHNEGVEEEKKHWVLFKGRFPNLEIFWQQFIVPATKRIEVIRKAGDKTGYRTRVRIDIQYITSLHYSVFKKLLYCSRDTSESRSSSFEDFWAHLVSALDLAETFLLENYRLERECSGGDINIRKLDQGNFLKKAEDWYNKHYVKNLSMFDQRWRPVTWGIHKRKDLLVNYFSRSKEWEKYDRYSQKVKTYRNFSIHDIGPGRIEIRENNKRLVPKLEKVSKYRTWQAFHRILNDCEGIDDAINEQDLMKSVLFQGEAILNKLWEKPIGDLKRLFEEKNEVVLKKYNIELL